MINLVSDECLVIIFLFSCGLFLGSFLNVMIYRLPRGESIILPPSHCPHCQHRLSPLDLVPLISFLFLRGQCRYCRVKISWRYPLAELVTGILTVIWWLCYGQHEINIVTLVILILSYALFVIAMIDIDHQIIPDKITIPLMMGGFIYQFTTGIFLTGFWGFIIGGGLLLPIYLGYSRGLGLGDVKLMALVGTFVGWQKAVGVLFLGSILGIAVMLPFLLIQKKNRKTPFAFGPFLVLATWIVLYRWDLIGRLWPG